MTVRIATFNAENLFRRPRVFALPGAAERRRTLEDFAALVALLDHAVYTAADKKRIAALLEKYDVPSAQSKTRPILVNETKGGAKLYKVRKGGAVEIAAEGRTGWVGWAELVRDDVDQEAVHNTARVIAEIDADILLTVEVEDRLTLHRFNAQVLAAQGAGRYPFNLLIDGNDSRGIDVGLFSRLPVTALRSHIFDVDPARPLFSRDCAEFEIQLPDGEPLWLLGNHFKSKGYGKPAESAEKRRLQAQRVRQIYTAALKRSSRVVVAGDLNDTPDSEPIGLLLRARMKDVMSHRGYTGAPGTYGTGQSVKQKIDYLLLSPELWKRVETVDVERRGVWAPNTFPSFDTVTSKANQASDHGALYADLAV
ncbi:endonuclease/exonuclease/phosphatase family protein [Streptomyces sp. NPDC020141]|uniref:endonuclease/exonuclease/phosphatase family protein n=1 Tax=Streptomyces sp. NPDC020141 TaxID=3365065 RepID=UPI00378E1C4D